MRTFPERPQVTISMTRLFASPRAPASYPAGCPGRHPALRAGTALRPSLVNRPPNTLARQGSALSLVLHRSGSMATAAGNGHSRVELLRTAVSTFIDLMQQGDG